jgi:hypothetical protein
MGGPMMLWFLVIVVGVLLGPYLMLVIAELYVYRRMR